ncbi:MAG: 8-amino-7-oxononanoate synthase [Kiritimatiellia bacterium]|jgi:8-amino-7-oxononanoate synthase|nr:8-amino-7-oxononanoate synthase [Kiritimatiellia bacterium]MDP6848485.1 8-amino-7-oxononanoate synthase [Kiritimatiellia bacterium]
MNGLVDTKQAKELAAVEADGRLRSLKEMGSRSGKWIDYEGRRMLNLSSNDYMGYASDRELVKTFHDQRSDDNLLDEYGLGSSASRLLSGNHSAYRQLEALLENLYGQPALIFSSGYHANIGVLSSLADRDDLILLDKLVHASVLDGTRLAVAERQRYRHLDMAHLKKILEAKRNRYKKVFVVTESVFSMDGDVADLSALVKLKEEFDLTLYVDEAHAVGTRGARGLGVAEEQGVLPDVDILIGTFGKSVGGMGAFVVCRPLIKEYLVNTSRSLIFTTGLPPIIVRWNQWIIENMCRDGERRDRVSSLAERFRTRLGEMGLATAGDSQIVPVIVGENQKAVDLAQRLRDKGFLVFAIRPPTVPPGTARLRFSLSSNMNWEDLSGMFPVLAGEDSQ